MADGKLTDRAIRMLKERGRYGDGNTLYLVVTPGGSKQWVQAGDYRGEEHRSGIGRIPSRVSQEARDQSRSFGNWLAPGLTRARHSAASQTFAEAAGKVH